MSQPTSINKIASASVNAAVLSFLNGKELACVARTQKAWKVLVDSRPDLSQRLADTNQRVLREINRARASQSIH